MNRLWVICPICRKKHVFRRCRWKPIGQTEQGWDVHVAPVTGTLDTGSTSIFDDLQHARELIAAGNLGYEAPIFRPQVATFSFTPTPEGLNALLGIPVYTSPLVPDLKTAIIVDKRAIYLKYPYWLLVALLELRQDLRANLDRLVADVEERWFG